MRLVRFTVHGDPLPKGSTRALIPKGWTRPVITSATKGLKKWEATIAAIAGEHMEGEWMTGAVNVRMYFTLTRPKSLPKKQFHHIKRPDLDKLTRAAIDAMTRVIWRDDSQVVLIQAGKRYTGPKTGESPRVEFDIEELA